MRPLVLLLTLLALARVASQAPGPSSALEVQPAVGAGADAMSAGLRHARDVAGGDEGHDARGLRR